MALPEHLEGLLDPAGYPHPCEQIELIETHISWVILTGPFAYKLKKPIRFNFVDFSTLARRTHFCREEVRCNRAFAGDLYQGLAAICSTPGGLVVRPESTIAQGEPAGLIEWAVQMRQFDPAQALDQKLSTDGLADDALDEFGRSLAHLHQALPRLDGRPDQVPVRVFGPVEDNFREIAGTALADAHRSEVAAAESSARRLSAALRAQFDSRISTGFVRECHGDLHLANLTFIDGTVTAFDCLEFNENLRWIDTMSDVAFLFMDCHFRGRVALAYRFLDGYLDTSGDYDGARLLHYFAAYRSVVRAKVAALRWVQAPDDEGAAKFIEHIRWAGGWLARPPGQLILTCGLSGSGKSYLAARLLAALPAVRLRSDVARKSLAGMDALDASGSAIDSGLYDPVRTDETFAHLAKMASGLLQAGENVIVDATFIERARRDTFIALADALGVRATVLFCHAPEALLRRRIVARAAAGADPSEADERVLAMQQARFEIPGQGERVLRMDMSEDLTEARVAELVAALG